MISLHRISLSKSRRRFRYPCKCRIPHLSSLP